MEFWIVILIIGSIIYFIGQTKPKQQNKTAKPPVPHNKQTEEPNRNKVLSILNGISGFNPDRIIESKQLLYIFGEDRKNQKVAFVTSDLAVIVIKYDDLISSKINLSNQPLSGGPVKPDTCIYIDIKRAHFNSPSISIECYNTEKLVNRSTSPIRNQLMLNAIYDDELSSALQVNKILTTIINQKSKTAPSTPPQVVINTKQEKIQNTETKPIQQSTIQLTEIKTELKKTNTEIKNDYKTLLENDTAKEEVLELEKDIHAKMSETSSSSPEKTPEIAGKVKISIAELDNIIKGVFPNIEITSIINDARMRGLKEVYIDENQIKTLKEQTSSISEALTTDSAIGYKPIDYKSSYIEPNSEY